jgi:hypothetical protein
MASGSWPVRVLSAGIIAIAASTSGLFVFRELFEKIVLLFVIFLLFRGLVSFNAEPGGGTTDYSCHFFKSAVQFGKYDCFVRSDTRLPLQSMPDALDAIVLLMSSDRTALTRTTYNVGGFSCQAKQIEEGWQHN